MYYVDKDEVQKHSYNTVTPLPIHVMNKLNLN